MAQAEINLLSKLADKYYKIGRRKPRRNWSDLLKAHSLYNSCGQRSGDEKWSREAFKVQQIYWNQRVETAYNDQVKLRQTHQAELQKIRDGCTNDIKQATDLVNKWDYDHNNLYSDSNIESSKEFCGVMKCVSLACNKKMEEFARNLIQESVALCKPSTPCKFVVVAMGSLAKGEATPYSDLEFMFLIEKKTPANMEYFELLAMTIYFLIGNIQETKLKYMNIKELKEQGFVDQGKNGFKIDGLQAKAGNIPTGNGMPEQKNKFILTVSELIGKYKEVLDNPDPKESLKGDFTAMIAHTTAIYGEKRLLEDFQSVKNVMCSNQERQIAHSKMIQQDIKDYSFLPEESVRNSHTFKQGDLKSDVYRFPSILIYNLKIIYNINSSTSWETLDELYKRNRISESFYHGLRFLLASALHIRLSAYLYHDSQNESISFLPKLASVSKESHTKNAYHLRRPLMFFMSLHMIPVKRQLKDKTAESVIHALKRKVHFEKKLSAATVWFYLKNWVQVTHILEEIGAKRMEHLQMLAHCYLGLKSWAKYQPIVSEILRRLQSVKVKESVIDDGTFCYNDILYWQFKSMTGFADQQNLIEAERLLKLLAPFVTLKHPLSLEMFLHIGRFYRLTKRFPLARHYYQLSNQALQKLPLDKELKRFYEAIYSYEYGSMLLDMTIFDEAKKEFERSLRIREDIYGKDCLHFEVADSYHALGNAHHCLGDNLKGVEFQEKAIQMYKKLYETDHEDLSISDKHNMLALCYEGLEKLEKTLENYKESYRIIQYHYQHNHHIVGDIVRRIGATLVKMDRLSEAEVHLSEALSIYLSIDTQYHKAHLCRCYLDLGHWNTFKGLHSVALNYYEQAALIPVNRADIYHREVIFQSLASMSKIYWENERPREAIENTIIALSHVPENPSSSIHSVIEGSFDRLVSMLDPFTRSSKISAPHIYELHGSAMRMIARFEYRGSAEAELAAIKIGAFLWFHWLLLLKIEVENSRRK